MTESNVITLRPRANAPVQPLEPRRSLSELASLTYAHVCPTLISAKAGHAEGLSQAVRSLAFELKALGKTREAAQLVECADRLETVSAMLEIDSELFK